MVIVGENWSHLNPPGLGAVGCSSSSPGGKQLLPALSSWWGWFVVMMMSMMKVRRSITMTVMVTLSTCPPCSLFSGCPSDPDSSPLARPKCHSLLFFCHCHNHPQSYIGHLGLNDILRHFWQISLSHLQRTILETFDLWDTDYNVDNWEPEFMTIKSDTGQYSQFLWRFIKQIPQALKTVK